ncbi:hypothetical protein OAA09_00640 [bacterium]|nr:hypothetical protein [bacterium]
MKKLKTVDIDRIIKEELALLREKVEEGVDSIDRQIDSFFLDYERDSALPRQEESKTLRSALDYLFEEEEESEEPTPEEDPDSASDDEIKDMIQKLKSAGYDIRLTVDDSSVEVDDPGEELQQPMNTDDFAARVTRLMDNFHNLVDVESTIRNRARQFMLDRYDKASADDLDDKLDQLTRKPGDESEKPEAPMAVGAGASKIA